MRICYFTHSLASCWNHGNAHFLRGVLRDLILAGHEVRAYEPRGSWSLSQLLRDHGEEGLDAYRRAYPELSSQEYDDGDDISERVDGADLVHRSRVERAVVGGRARPLASAGRTLHPAVSTTPIIVRSAILRRSAATISTATMACSRSARPWRRCTGAGAGATARSSGTRRRTSGCSSRPQPSVTPGSGLDRQLGRRGALARDRGISAASSRRSRACLSTSTAYAIPSMASPRCGGTARDYRGWLANARAPEIFARHSQPSTCRAAFTSRCCRAFQRSECSRRSPAAYRC